jgi:hypothetical protein
MKKKGQKLYKNQQSCLANLNGPAQQCLTPRQTPTALSVKTPFISHLENNVRKI